MVAGLIKESNRQIDAAEFIKNMPKAELHVHVEGSIAPQMILDMAFKNHIDIPYKTVEALLDAQNYGNEGVESLNNFLDYLTICKQVVCTEEDFYNLTYALIRRLRDEGVVYAEIMLDPQSALERGVRFEDCFLGMRRGMKDGQRDFSVESQLVMNLHRDKSCEDALAVMDMARPYCEEIVGVGLDNYELDDFPRNFVPLFEQARKEGYRLTSHCDNDLAKSVDHIGDCLYLLGVERLDHGLNCLDAPELLEEVKQRRIPLTVCPLRFHSDPKPRWLGPLKTLYDHGVLVSVNSDDPSLFATGFLGNLMCEVYEHSEFSLNDMVRLTENAYISSWLPEDRKAAYIANLKDYANANGVEYS